MDKTNNKSALWQILSYMCSSSSYLFSSQIIKIKTDQKINTQKV